MVSPVTPMVVAPLLSAPAGHGTAHAGAFTNEIRILLVVGLQSGACSAAAVPRPAPVGETGAALPPAVRAPPWGVEPDAAIGDRPLGAAVPVGPAEAVPPTAGAGPGSVVTAATGSARLLVAPASDEVTPAVVLDATFAARR